MPDKKELAQRRKTAEEAYKSRVHNDNPAWKAWLITHKILLIIVVSVVLGLPAIAIASDAVAYNGKVHPGVNIGPVDIGGMSEANAAAVLRDSFERALLQPVSVSGQGHDWTMDKATLSPRPKLDEAIQVAMRYGRSGGVFKRLGDRFVGFFTPQVFRMGATVDSVALDGFINQVATEVDRAPRDAGASIDASEVVITPASSGIKVDKDRLGQQIESSIFELDRTELALPVKVIEPSVTEDEAKEAGEKAKIALSGPVELTYLEDSWTLTVEDLQGLLVFIPVTEDGEELLGVGFDSTGYAAKLAELTRDYRKEPVDAKFIVEGVSVTIEPHTQGVEVDTEAGRKATEAAVAEDGTRQVALVTHTTDPERTTEAAEAMGIKERITAYTTKYSSSNRSRVTNIKVLSKALDGTILAPDATFSFNGTIGQRTAAKGYKEAPVISDGQLVPDLGGGVCQVSTTVFNAVFFAGLPVVDRSNHSLYISKYPTGRDASVSWPGLDFKFKNDTDNYILIDAYASDTAVTIAFYGTDMKRQIEYNTSGFYGFRAFGEKTIENATLDEGVRNAQSSGRQGRSVTVNRTVKDEQGALMWEEKFTSVYRPQNAIVEVGTKPIPEPEEDTGTADGGSTEDASS